MLAADLAVVIAAALVRAPVIVDVPAVGVGRFAGMMNATAPVGAAAAEGGFAPGVVVAADGSALVGAAVAEDAAALQVAAAADGAAALVAAVVAVAAGAAAVEVGGNDVSANATAVVEYAAEVGAVLVVAVTALVLAPLAWGLHYSSLLEPQQTSFVAQQQLLPLSSQSQ